MNEWRMNETHLQTQWILDRDDDPASKQIETSKKKTKKKEKKTDCDTENFLLLLFFLLSFSLEMYNICLETRPTIFVFGIPIFFLAFYCQLIRNDIRNLQWPPPPPIILDAIQKTTRIE